MMDLQVETQIRSQAPECINKRLTARIAFASTLWWQKSLALCLNFLSCRKDQRCKMTSKGPPTQLGLAFRNSPFYLSLAVQETKFG